jgi:predicted ribonuclease YlaK
MACAMAMMEDRRFGIQRVDIFRAAITDESENIGFLPGTEEDKIRPFIEPMAEALVDLGFHLETENPKISLLDELRRLKVYFRSTGFMRGRNLYNSAVVIDEAQNLTYRQLRKLLTRVVNRPVGHSKVILCGSLEQIDLPKKWPSGLKYWMDVAQEEWGTNAVHRLPKTMRGDGVERLLARASQMPYQAA